MTEIDDISARLAVLETVIKQLITHMAVRDDDPPAWIRTRRTLAISALGQDGADPDDLIHDAVAEFFDHAEMVARRYTWQGKEATSRPLMR